MNTKIKSGDLCRIKGSFAKYRYVKKNILRCVESGKLYSVKYSQIRSYNATPKEQAVILALCIAAMAALLIHALC